MNSDSGMENQLQEALEKFRTESMDILDRHGEQMQELLAKYSGEFSELKDEVSSLPDSLASCQKTEKEIDGIHDKAAKLLAAIEDKSSTIAEKTEETRAKASELFAELKAYQEKVFGAIKVEREEINLRDYNQLDDEDRLEENGKYYSLTRENVPGMKDELAYLVSEYRDFISKDKEYAARRGEEISAEADKLYKRIESLLPGATAAGLSESYYRSEKASLWKVRLWIGIFVAALLGFIITGWVLFSKDIIQFPADPSLGATLSQLARALFFESPFIWLGVTANVKMAQYTRLNEEYRHKWAMMRVFDGMRTVLNDEAIIDREGSNIDFYKALLAMFNENPSRLLDRKYDPDSPLSLLDRLRPSKGKGDEEKDKEKAE